MTALKSVMKMHKINHTFSDDESVQFTYITVISTAYIAALPLYFNIPL